MARETKAERIKRAKAELESLEEKKRVLEETRHRTSKQRVAESHAGDSAE